MRIETRKDAVDYSKDYSYAKQYAIYDESDLNGYTITDAKKSTFWKNPDEDRKVVATNVVCSINHTGKKFYAYIILKPFGTDWIVEGIISSTTTPVQVYNYFDIPLFKNMGISIGDLISKLKKRYNNKISIIEKEIKENQINHKNNEIETEDIVGELRRFIAQYNGTLEMFPSKDNRISLMNYKFVCDGNTLIFQANKIFKYNLECWKVYWGLSWVKDYYDMYLKGNDFETMKQLLQSFCLMVTCKKDNYNGSYYGFIKKK